MKIDWYECEKQASQERIKSVEKEIGLSFPQSFIDLMKECDGGWPEIGSFSFDNTFLGVVMGSSISNFLSFTEDTRVTEHLIGIYKLFYDRFPKNVIAFGYTGSGDYICFDYRKDKKTSNPEIVYWEHSAPDDESISFVARNFDAFMAMLHPFDESLLD